MSKTPKPRVTLDGIMLHCWVCGWDFAINMFEGAEKCPKCKVKFEVFE